MMPLSQYWRTLPQRTRRALLTGSVGPDHLDETASVAEAEGLPRLALDLQFAAWEHYPLDGVFAAKVLERANGGGAAPRDLPVELLQAVRSSWQQPVDGNGVNGGDSLQNLAKAREFEQAYDLASRCLEAEGHNLYWCEQLLVLGMMTGRGEEAGRFVLQAPVLQQEEFEPLLQYLRAEARFASGEYAEAQRTYGQVMEHPAAKGWLAPLERRAEACWRLGWRDRALELWKQCIEERPWHSNMILRVHAAVAPLEELENFPATAVLVYSYNKAKYLDATLGALAETRGAALIVALDNGSTDETPEVLAGWLDRLGGECLKTLRLPVNVGAPAARNWLAALPELDEMECAAYLDDDAIPPPDWLEMLHGARQACPDAAAWGCRVMDYGAPEIIQSADVHLQLALDETGAPRVVFDLEYACAEPFRMSELHAQVADRGQFDYFRPCASVTGCCHLLDVEELRSTGFDLRYTPSQYDDLDRDLRRAMEGRFCCYHGGLAVRHRKRSGRAASMNTLAMGNWLGNRYKLLNRFTREELVSLWENEGRVMLEDLERKLSELEDLLGFPGLAERL